MQKEQRHYEPEFIVLGTMNGLSVAKKRDEKTRKQRLSNLRAALIIFLFLSCNSLRSIYYDKFSFIMSLFFSC